MGLNERRYVPYAGPTTATWSRFLVLSRYALRDVLRERLVVLLLVVSGIYPLGAALLIYARYNLGFLALLNIQSADRFLPPIGVSFFEVLLVVQGVLAFFLTLFIAPPMIARDLANNGLALYLCRPLSRFEYVIGKMTALLWLLTCTTWLPGLLLWSLQAGMAGGGWGADHLRILLGIVVGSWLWMMVLALLAFAISAWVRWKLAAKAALLGVFFIPSIFGNVIDARFATHWGRLLNLLELMRVTCGGLFGNYTAGESVVAVYSNGQAIDVVVRDIPQWSAWAVLAVLCATCVLMLSRKVRAYEAVRG